MSKCIIVFSHGLGLVVLGEVGPALDHVKEHGMVKVPFKLNGVCYADVEVRQGDLDLSNVRIVNKEEWMAYAEAKAPAGWGLSVGLIRPRTLADWKEG